MFTPFFRARILVWVGCLAFAGVVQADLPATSTLPDAIADLMTPAGADLLAAKWRYADVRVVEVDGARAGTRSNDIEPKGGALDFDDRAWTVIEPQTLGERRASGKLCFGWYRINVTIPAKVGSFDPTGATVVFEAVVDDYAEIWVDGKLPLVIGATGGRVAAGFNAINQVVLTRDARPGQRIQIAVFGINAPLSIAPGNFVWFRSATIDFYRPGRFRPTSEVPIEVERKDAALDAIVPAGLRCERVATGFSFTEGPVWIPQPAGGGGSALGAGSLLFSDPNRNTIYRWSADDGVTVFRTKSGYSGIDIAEYSQPGSNGLTLDPNGRLTICEHGNRRVTRYELGGGAVPLAERYEGKRLNSPNDLVFRSDGALYFTDPFFGLPKFGEDPRRELEVTGVFCVRDGALRLVADDLSGPNGLAFSPDEKLLYVGNWDDKRKVLMCYEVAADGALSNGRVLCDMTAAKGDDALDGVKVDQRGNIYVSGPGGLWILSPEGKHLGTLRPPEHPHNMAWGDDDGQSLFLAAQTSIYRARLKVPGIRPMPR